MLRTLISSIIATGTMASFALADTARAPTNDQVIEALFEAFNDHDVARIRDFYTDDAVVYSPEACEPTVGPDAIAAGYAEMFQQIPDVHDELTLVVSEGDRVAVTFTATGTVEGYSFELPIAAFLQMEDGKIKEDRVYFDTDMVLDCTN